MATVKVTRTIDAPMDFVFQTVSDPRRFAQAIDGVTELTFLSQVTKGAGTRFRQTRELNGKAMTMDFEITEHVPNNRVRIHNEVHDTEWDSLFTLAPSGAGTVLTRCMTTRSHRLLPRLLMPVVCLLIKKSVERDFDAVKASCEASS
jgi:uncharacterized protein YndB with AHSA1/START domain